MERAGSDDRPRCLRVSSTPRSQQMVVVGCVEPAVRRSLARKRASDQDQRTASYLRFFHFGAYVAQAALDQALVGPADSTGNYRRAVRSVMRSQYTHDAREVVNGKMYS